jgi:uncharacterized membrane protein
MPEGDEGHDAPPPTLDLNDTTGTDLSRILSLSDGIFGFAMTLMVLTLVIPVWTNPSAAPTSGWLAAQLQGEASEFEWYALGFVLIAAWWVAHHALFAKIRKWDRRIVGLNLAFLLTIAAAPFFIELLEKFSELQTSVAAYAASQVLTSLCFTGLCFYTTNRPGIVDARIGRPERVVFQRRAVLRTSVFLIALGIAFVDYQYALYVLLATLLIQSYRRTSALPKHPDHPGGRVPGRRRGAAPEVPTVPLPSTGESR